MTHIRLVLISFWVQRAGLVVIVLVWLFPSSDLLSHVTLIVDILFRNAFRFWGFILVFIQMIPEDYIWILMASHIALILKLTMIDSRRSLFVLVSLLDLTIWALSDACYSILSIRIYSHLNWTGMLLLLFLFSLFISLQHNKLIGSQSFVNQVNVKADQVEQE